MSDNIDEIIEKVLGVRLCVSGVITQDELRAVAKAAYANGRQEAHREVRKKRGEILNSFPADVPVDTLLAWKMETRWLAEKVKEGE